MKGGHLSFERHQFFVVKAFESKSETAMINHWRAHTHVHTHTCTHRTRFAHRHQHPERIKKADVNEHLNDTWVNNNANGCSLLIIYPFHFDSILCETYQKELLCSISNKKI